MLSGYISAFQHYLPAPNSTVVFLDVNLNPPCSRSLEEAPLPPRLVYSFCVLCLLRNELI